MVSFVTRAVLDSLTELNHALETSVQAVNGAINGKEVKKIPLKIYSTVMR